MKNFNLNRLKYQNREWLRSYLTTIQITAFVAGYVTGAIVAFVLLLIFNFLGW